MKKYGVLLFFLLMSGFSVSYASPKIYDLNETIEIAVKNNYDLQLTGAQISTATSGLRAAFGSYLPSIGFSAGYNRQLNPQGSKNMIINGIVFNIPGSDPNSFSMGANAGLTLFDGFSREAQYASAKEKLKASGYTERYTTQYVVYQSYLLYTNLIRNWQIVKVRRENLNQGRAELEQIKARFDAGIIAIDAVYTQEADLGNRESQLIEAENEFNKSKSMLLSLMGFDPTLECEFLESSLPTEIKPENVSYFRSTIGSFPQAVARSLENRYDYKATESNIVIAREGVRQAYSSYSPNLSASLGWNWQNTKMTGLDSLSRWYAGISLQIPIFSNFQPNNYVQQAKLQLTEQEINQKKAEQSLKQAIQNAFLNLGAAEKQIDVTARSVVSAKQNYESMKEKFNVGTASTTELTLANSQLIAAQINAVNAVYGYIFAQKEVLFSIGDIK
ncbi:MAG: TolC family protein [bacterium]